MKISMSEGIYKEKMGLLIILELILEVINLKNMLYYKTVSLIQHEMFSWLWGQSHDPEHDSWLSLHDRETDHEHTYVRIE